MSFPSQAPRMKSRIINALRAEHKMLRKGSGAGVRRWANSEDGRISGWPRMAPRLALPLCRRALALESFRAVEPPRGHPDPGRLAFRIASELGHPLAIGGISKEFLGRVHRVAPCG